MYTEDGMVTVYNAATLRQESYYVILVSLYADSPG